MVVIRKPAQEGQQVVELGLDDLEMESSLEDNTPQPSNVRDSAPIARYCPPAQSANVEEPDETSFRASSTALPLALTSSTTLTRQQDGQGLAMDLENFDLSQAIADAGSFLQSWDIEKELNFSGNKTGSSSSARLQTIMTVNAIHHG